MSEAEKLQAEEWRMLRDMLGYVANGSSTSVTICQDDATNNWSVTVGKRSYHHHSLEAALRAAHAVHGDTT